MKSAFSRSILISCAFYAINISTATHMPTLNVSINLYLKDTKETILDQTLVCTPNNEDNYDITETSPLLMQLNTNATWYPRFKIQKVSLYDSKTVMMEYLIANPQNNAALYEKPVFINIPYTTQLTPSVSIYLLITNRNIPNK